MDGVLDNTLAASQPDLLGAALKTFATLCVVLGLLIVILYLIRRLFYLKNSLNDDHLMSMIASFYLAPKTRIVLMEVMGEKLVVSVSQEGVRFLTKIESSTEQANEGISTKAGIHES